MAEPRSTPPPKDEDLSKGERTRLEILQAAQELFSRQGYHGTSMRQIANRAEIALGGIYNHFGGKEDIFREVSLLNHPIHTILPALEGEEGETVEEFVHLSAEQMYVALSEGEDFLNLMFIEVVEFKGRHFPAMFSEMFPRALSFGTRLREKRGTLREEIPFQLMMVTFTGLMFAFFMFQRVFGAHSDFGPPQKLLRQVVDIYLHGILREVKKDRKQP
ncbi:MAG: helix-turn-helix domain-containing protein [Anaerolineales bacterium]|jgi:AcrR family transcriptional regulator